jgi:hypothetical protein
MQCYGTKYYFAILKGFNPLSNDFVNAPVALRELYLFHTSILAVFFFKIQTIIFVSDI